MPFVILEKPLSSYLESRYYYLGVVGGAILLGVLFESARLMFSKTKFAPLFSLFLIIFGGFILYKNSIFVQREVKRQVILASERRQFLSAAKTMRPDLPDDPIIFIAGDSPGYYGLADLSVPFQQGMGYTMMVWYFDTGVIPRGLLRDMYLWNINQQGYREVNGKGFGYFYQMEKLKETFNREPMLMPEQVIGFSYIAGTRELTDITEQVRKQLQ